MDRLDVIELTAGKPFTAGAVVLVEGRLVVTLDRDHLPPAYERDWDDVAALLLVRPADCPLLTGEPTIAEVGPNPLFRVRRFMTHQARESAQTPGWIAI